MADVHTLFFSDANTVFFGRHRQPFDTHANYVPLVYDIGDDSAATMPGDHNNDGLMGYSYEDACFEVRSLRARAASQSTLVVLPGRSVPVRPNDVRVYPTSPVTTSPASSAPASPLTTTPASSAPASPSAGPTYPPGMPTAIPLYPDAMPGSAQPIPQLRPSVMNRDLDTIIDDMPASYLRLAAAAGLTSDEHLRSAINTSSDYIPTLSWPPVLGTRRYDPYGRRPPPRTVTIVKSETNVKSKTYYSSSGSEAEEASPLAHLFADSTSPSSSGSPGSEFDMSE